MAAATTFTLGVVSTICALFGQEKEPAAEIRYEMPAGVHCRAEVCERMSIDGNRLFEISSMPEVRECMMVAANDRIAGSAVTGSLEIGYQERASLPSIAAAGPCRTRTISPRAYRALSLISPSRPPALNEIRQICLPNVISISPGRGPLPGDLVAMKIAIRNLHNRLCDAGSDITGPLDAGRIKLYLRESERALKNLTR